MKNDRKKENTYGTENMVDKPVIDEMKYEMDYKSERKAVNPMYSLWLHNIPGMTNIRIMKLLEQVDSSEDFYAWSGERMKNETSLTVEEIHAITASRISWNLEEEWMRLVEMGISYVSMEQREYPAQLRNIHNPPFGLYYKGRLPGDDRQTGCGALTAVRHENTGDKSEGHAAAENLAAKESFVKYAGKDSVAEPPIPYMRSAGEDSWRGEADDTESGECGIKFENCDTKSGRQMEKSGKYDTKSERCDAESKNGGMETEMYSGKSVAIVGARSRSEYGLQVARQLGETLARNGVAVISGLARGIDADAHIGALDGGGRTYAVLGCGVDICYPRSNRYLYDRILEHGGGILSEYPPGQTPLAGLFPQRNRIISGLSDCVVVVEARKKSGSLITADFAMEQGRDVYAVPGRVGETLSEGTNRLIYQGAGIYMGPEEFLSELHLGGKFTLDLNFSKKKLEKEESLVYSVLDLNPIGLGTILQKTSIPLEHLLEILASLVEKGYIWESVPNYYVRRII